MTTIRSKQVKVHIIAYFALHDQCGVIAKKLSLTQTTILCERFVAAAVVASLTACLLLRTRVLIRTSNMKNSRRHLAAYVRKLHQKACCTGRAAQLFFLIQPIKSSTREGGKNEKYIFFFYLITRLALCAKNSHEHRITACCASSSNNRKLVARPDFFPQQQQQHSALFA